MSRTIIFFGTDGGPLDRLAEAEFLNCSGPESQPMAMFSAYFDASGNAKDQPFVAVSGFIANYLQWKLFQGEWEDAHKKYGVELPFHMVEFVAACRSPHYKNQRNARADYVAIAADSAKSEAFLRQLSGCQLAYMHCGISCLVDMDIYRQVDSSYDLRKVIPPYALGARMCIQRVQQWGQNYGVKDRPELIFEEGDFEQGKFTQLMVDEGEPLPIYKKKKDYAGLQAADQYAWEQTHFLKEYRKGPVGPAREMFAWVLNGIPRLHVHAPLDFLINLCQAKGIEKKK